MSDYTFLVSFDAMHCAMVAVSGSTGMGPSQEPKGLALFCDAFRGKSVIMLTEDDLEKMGISSSVLIEWKDEEAEALYEQTTGRPARQAGKA